MSGRSLTGALAERVAAARAAGRTPIAVLDVDLTLVDNAPRNRAIWAEFFHAIRDRWPGAEEASVRAATMPIVFSVRDNLAALGLDDPQLLDEGLRFWLEAFFSDRWLGADTALPGAVAAVAALRAADVTVAYLTARTAAMAAGTASRLRELGFPVAVPGTLLVMKPSMGQRDSVYKGEALAWLEGLGTPIVVADNEPGHVNAMHARCPGAVAVLVDTRHSPGAPPLSEAAERHPTLAGALLAPANQEPSP